MHLIYTTRRRGFEPGRQYRNPRFFAGADKAATSVTVEGHHPDVVAAYEAAGIEVEVIGTDEERPDDAESDERARRAELMNAIEHATGKRPGANTKTETLEQRMAEIESGSQDEDGQE
ncbi:MULTISPECIES: hypothetical protein [unclassified Halomonas]|mgnify:FL=1|uniref:hypothetical protein n=1 Tax=unclassified Halomonas TaxID=2609666 RepID=UPI000C8EC72B|nr:MULTISPECIES: hypothetical protein [unclassified Halomonas]MAR74370.1 hypothetical protein [Halomonas sp.]|tara:strand:+ start:2162 stop:2515 length:354 start_codon:yes stop_codon:yes gene_type:complete